MRIVAISDSHGTHRGISLPPGDVLVFAGDITLKGEQHVIADFVEWLAAQPFKHKVFIAGNHDHWAEQKPEKMHELADSAGVHYLSAEGATLDGIRFWGSPYTPEFMNWSFMLPPGSAAVEHWRRMPANTDVLITHGPPFGVLDTVVKPGKSLQQSGNQVGCPELLQRVRQNEVKVHIFGHIHEGYGQMNIEETRFFNVSQLDNRYQMTNQPVVIDVEVSPKAESTTETVSEETTDPF